MSAIAVDANMMRAEQDGGAYIEKAEVLAMVDKSLQEYAASLRGGKPLHNARAVADAL